MESILNFKLNKDDSPEDIQRKLILLEKLCESKEPIKENIETDASNVQELLKENRLLRAENERLKQRLGIQ
jgi:regulator of replication initiation timing